MPLRTHMCGQLRAQRSARGMSLEQVGRRAGLARTAVHTIETAASGEFLDRLEAIAAAVGARYVVDLVPDEQAPGVQELIACVRAMPPALVAELLPIAAAWEHLSADDRDLLALLCRRRADAPPQVDADPLPSPARRRA